MPSAFYDDQPDHIETEELSELLDTPAQALEHALPND